MAISVSDIDFSPLNYRKLFSEEALQLFAQELAQHGIISPLLLRRKSENRYELVAGERRLRAAKIAKFQTIPAQIAELTDQQVREIQLSENLQRENPHPMNEASAIGDMQQAGLNIDEIALRLGKSKQFVYTRLKLLNLIEAFQEMVFADVISIADALQIATLSEGSQNEFFIDQCKDWQKKKGFKLNNIVYYLNHYRYDLKRAPFNTKDKNLVPEAGACSVCPSNSATLKSLFPEVAKESICSNKECYNNKCIVHYMAALGNSITTYQPVALIYKNQLTETDEKLIHLIPGAAELPQHNSYDISIMTKPQEPDKENYMYDTGKGKAKLDKEEYDEAIEEYNSELEAYNLHVESEHYKIAVLLDGKDFIPVYFSLEKSKQSRNGQTVTAKDVQIAIKSGTATPDLLKSEIARIKDREKRSEELDTEKIQLTVHNLFSEFAAKPENNKTLTAADMTGARLIIYQSLDYSTKQKVSEILFKEKGKRKRSDDSLEGLYERFSTMTKQEFSYLIRMAISCKSESKYPAQQAGYFLYQMAKQAGITVKSVEDAQAEKAKERKEKQAVRIKELDGKIKKLKTK